MILLYHNLVPAFAPNGYTYTSLTLQEAVFERHIRWLSTYCEIVSLSDYLACIVGTQKGKKRRVAITFDDGTATSFACAFPILQKFKAPATFFVTTCHLNGGELMPGCYLNALCYEDIYPELELRGQRFSLETPAARKHTRQSIGALAEASENPFEYIRRLTQRYPLPPNIRALYEGMSVQQLSLAVNSGLIEIGSHTVTHPDLSRLPADQQKTEIQESQQILSDLTGREVRYFAYPSGQYDRKTIELVKRSGYLAAFATIPRNLGDDSVFELERVGIYSSSLLKVFLKVAGGAVVLRRMGVRVG